MRVAVSSICCQGDDAKPACENLVLLVVKGLVVFDQQVGNGALTNLDADVGEKLTDFSLAHQAAKVQHEREGFDAGAKLATRSLRAAGRDNSCW